MKDLTSEYVAAIERQVAELAARQAEIAFGQVAAIEAAAEAAKASIDATARDAREALETFRRRTVAEHNNLIAQMSERAREFFGERSASTEESATRPEPPALGRSEAEPAVAKEDDDVRLSE